MCCLCPIRDDALQVSTHDNLIPAAMQFELADQLRARTVTIPTGKGLNVGGLSVLIALEQCQW